MHLIPFVDFEKSITVNSAVFVKLDTWERFQDFNPFPLDISKYKVMAVLKKWIEVDKSAAMFHVEALHEYFDADISWMKVNSSLRLGEGYELLTREIYIKSYNNTSLESTDSISNQFDNEIDEISSEEYYSDFDEIGSNLENDKSERHGRCK